MRLLLDENVSYRVVNTISSVFSESMHVNKHVKALEDNQIFAFAKTNDFYIFIE